MKRTLCIILALILLSCLTLSCCSQVAVPSDDTDSRAEQSVSEDNELSLGSSSSLIVLGLLFVAMACALYFSTRRVKWNAALLAKAAICIALSYALCMLKLFRMPTGGSVTPVAMLPLILFATAFGPLEGVLVGCAFGLMKLLLDPYIIHPIQLITDYPMAYAALALCCLSSSIPSKRLRLPVAVLLGYMGRYLVSVLSGVVFFAEYAGDQPVLIYSLVYNISYLWPEILAGMLIALIPSVGRLPQLMRGKDLK